MTVSGYCLSYLDLIIEQFTHTFSKVEVRTVYIILEPVNKTLEALPCNLKTGVQVNEFPRCRPNWLPITAPRVHFGQTHSQFCMKSGSLIGARYDLDARGQQHEEVFQFLMSGALN